MEPADLLLNMPILAYMATYPGAAHVIDIPWYDQLSDPAGWQVRHQLLLPGLFLFTMTTVAGTITVLRPARRSTCQNKARLGLKESSWVPLVCTALHLTVACVWPSPPSVVCGFRCAGMFGNWQRWLCVLFDCLAHISRGYMQSVHSKAGAHWTPYTCILFVLHMQLQVPQTVLSNCTSRTPLQGSTQQPSAAYLAYSDGGPIFTLGVPGAPNCPVREAKSPTVLPDTVWPGVIGVPGALPAEVRELCIGQYHSSHIKYYCSYSIKEREVHGRMEVSISKECKQQKQLVQIYDRKPDCLH